MSYLEISHLNKRFGAINAIDDVGFSVNEGEMICLLGPSGCGKTTLLRILAGFERADSGSIYIDGQNITHQPAHKREFGMVFQSLALFPHMTVAENIAYGMKLRRYPLAQRRKRVLELLETIELPNISDRPVAELSGGQRQRVAIARALALQPKLFLLDEPLSALDAQIRENMQIELRQLQERFGITTLIVTHDQHEAMVLGDRLVVMNRGQIQQIDTPQRLYSEPNNAFVASFMGAANLLEVITVEANTIRYHDHRLHYPHQHASEQALQLAIRPENITLYPQAQANTLPAEVVLARPLGAVYEVMAKIGDTTLRCRGQDTLYAQAHSGMSVHLSFDTEKTRDFIHRR